MTERTRRIFSSSEIISQGNFKFADDGGGGSLVYAQVASGQPPLLVGADAVPIQVVGNNAPLQVRTHSLRA